MNQESIAAPGIGLAEPTQDEKAFASLAHALMPSTWWIGPLVIYLMKKESRFVGFHALQALFWQILFTVVAFGGMVVWSGLIIITTLHAEKQQGPSQFPIALFIVFPIFWLLYMGGFALTLVFAIVYSLKAMRGQWAGYPVLGRWARRIVGT